MKTITKIATVFIIIGLIGATTIFFIAGKEIFIQQGVPFKLSKAFPSDKLTNISIHVDSSDIQISKSPDNQVRLKIEGPFQRRPDVELHLSQDQQNLSLNIDSQPEFFQFRILDFTSLKKPKIHLDLPQKAYDQLTFYTNLGDITTTELISAKKLDLNTKIGDLRIQEFEGERVNGKTELGDVSFQHLIGQFELYTSKGDIEVLSVDQFKKNNSMKTELGDLKIQIPQEPSSLRVTAKTSLGQINSSYLTLTSKTDMPTNQELTGTLGNSNDIHAPMLTMTTELGDIEITK